MTGLARKVRVGLTITRDDSVAFVSILALVGSEENDQEASERCVLHRRAMGSSGVMCGCGMYNC